MWLLHPTQAEGGLGQAAAQRRTLSAEKALISKAFWIAKRVRSNYLTSDFQNSWRTTACAGCAFTICVTAVPACCWPTAFPSSTFRSGWGTAILPPRRTSTAHLDYKSKITSAQEMETGLALPESSDFGSRWREG